MSWFSHFGEQFIGNSIGKRRSHLFSNSGAKAGFPTRQIDLEADEDGNLWDRADVSESGVAKFDRKDGKNQPPFPIPAEWQKNTTQQAHISATAEQDRRQNLGEELRWFIDLAAGYSNRPIRNGSFDVPGMSKRITYYGIRMLGQQNNLTYIPRFRLRQRAASEGSTPKPSNSPTSCHRRDTRARRGKVDGQDRLWFGEYGGNAIGMLIRSRRRFPNGACRHRGRRLMTRSPIVTVRCGPAQ